MRKLKILDYRITLPESGMDLRATMLAIERHLIEQAMVKARGNKADASELLCLNRTTLVEKLKRMKDGTWE